MAQPQQVHPNAREVPPLFPQQFVSAPRPTAAFLYSTIPPEVNNLYRIVTDGVRHEENTYGYFNSAFAHIFPPSQRFQSNPQYPIRPSVQVGVGSHGRNISVGSTGAIHGARKTKREDNMKYPDFTFSKPLPRPPAAPRINCLFGVLEIKTSDDDANDIVTGKATVEEALRQTFDYTERLSDPAFAIWQHNSQIIASYIVYGKYYTKVTLSNHPHAGIIWDVEPWQFMFEEIALPNRAPFLYTLCELAVRDWDFNG